MKIKERREKRSTIAGARIPLSSTDDAPVSAQVVLQHGTAEIAARVVDYFRSTGFDVGPVVGGNFAITAPRRFFEDYFGIRLQTDAADASPGSLELPPSLSLDRLPHTMRSLVRLIAFTRRYGPLS